MNTSSNGKWKNKRREMDYRLRVCVSQPGCKKTAMKHLMEKQEQQNFDHISMLKIQGEIVRHLKQSTTKASLKEWSSEVEKLPSTLFIFTKKAIQQQLPTASNLVRWRKAKDPKCPLCQQLQTNKHVMSNCSLGTVLDRYKDRHDTVLTIVANWISNSVKPNCTVHADLPGNCFKPVSDLFQTLRPDVAILTSSTIETLELTICHETNTIKSKIYKETKYANLHQNLIKKYSGLKLNKYTMGMEVSTLGVISDTKLFSSKNLITSMPDHIKCDIVKSVISKSFSIYCNRLQSQSQIAIANCNCNRKTRSLDI